MPSAAPEHNNTRGTMEIPTDYGTVTAYTPKGEGFALLFAERCREQKDAVASPFFRRWHFRPVEQEGSAGPEENKP